MACAGRPLKEPRDRDGGRGNDGFIQVVNDQTISWVTSSLFFLNQASMKQNLTSPSEPPYIQAQS